MAVHDVEVVGVQPLQAALDRVPHPLRRVIEFGAANAAALGYDEVRAARVVLANGRCGESSPKEFFGRAIVWGGVEGADAEVEGARDYLVRRQCIGIDVELGVERGGTTNQGGEDGGEGRLCGSHSEVWRGGVQRQLSSQILVGK